MKGKFRLLFFFPTLRFYYFKKLILKRKFAENPYSRVSS